MRPVFGLLLILAFLLLLLQLFELARNELVIELRVGIRGVQGNGAPVSHQRRPVCLHGLLWIARLRRRPQAILRVSEVVGGVRLAR